MQNDFRKYFGNTCAECGKIKKIFLLFSLLVLVLVLVLVHVKNLTKTKIRTKTKSNT